MSQLHGFPAGLLSLVGSQSFGVNPKNLGEVVAPTIDLGGLYLLSAQVGTISIVAAPVNGNNNGGGMRVPTGEVWRVHAGGLFISNGGAASVDTITPVIIVNGGTIPIGETQDGGVPINTLRWCPMTCGPFWLQAGSELSAYISGIAGVPTLSICYLVSKLRA